MFGGGFGSLASSSAFGAPAQPAPAFGAPAFGAAQTGSSAFGGGFGQPAAATPALGGGGLFGTPQPQQQQSVFGQPQQAAATGMFGAAASQSSVFGQQPAVSAFGATPAVGGLGALQRQPQPQQPNPQLGYPTTGQGSRVLPFQPETIKQADQTQQFRHISAMSQYADKSTEELRFEDYAANCKGQPGGQPYPSVHPSKIGATGSVFGGAPAAGAGQAGFTQAFSNNTTAFGASSASTFGAPAASQSLFGAPASTPSLFGGQPASQPASIFGQPAANTTFGGASAFGQTQSAFGFSQQQPGLAGGTFGAASSASLFGAPQQQQAGAFGQQKPATGLFGQPAQSGSLFGNPMSAASTFGAASSASIFGQQASQSAFGSALKPATGFGTPSPSPFGQTVQQPAAGNIFGAPAASSASLFGSASSASLFGQSSASPFGQMPAASGGLFGQQQQADGFKPAGGGGLFGSGSSLFGGPAGQSSSSLFGASAPAAGSLFGAPASSTSLFGAPSSPSLFGAPAAQNQGTSLFAGPSMFGQAGAQQAAVAPVSPAVPGQAPYGALPTVPKVPEMRSGIAASAVSRSVAVPPPVLFRPKPRVATPVRASKASITPPSTDAQLSRRSPSIFRISYRDPGLVIHTPLPSTNSSTSGGGAATSEQLPASPAFISPSVRGSPSFAPAATPEIQPTNGISSTPVVPSIMHAMNSSQPDSSAMRFSPAEPPPPTSPALPLSATKLPTLPDGWWMKPSMDNLAATVARNPSVLKAVDRFTVGQAGVGSIMYLDDVDLSGIDKLEDVFCFEPGSVSAYYDGCKVGKHAQGHGVNRPARVQIELTGKQMNKIMRREDSRSSEEYLSQLKLRLKSLSAGIDATFIDLQVKGSKRAVWIFEVQHWSRYGLPQEYCEDEDDSDDEMDLLPWPESRQENQARANVPAPPPPEQSALGPKQVSDAGPSGMAAPAESYQLESEDATSEALDLQQESRLRVPPQPSMYPASPPRTALMPLQPLRDRIPTSVTHLSPPLSAEHALAAPPSAHVPFADDPAGAGNNWRLPRRPLQIVCQPGSADNSPLAGSASPWDSSSAPVRQALRGGDAASASVSAAHASASSSSAATALVDIGAVMSTTKRACISLQGQVVHVSHTMSSTQVHSIVSIHKLQPGALLLDSAHKSSKSAVAAVCDVLRQRADELLGVHTEHSAPARPGTSLTMHAEEEEMMNNDDDMEGPSGPQLTAAQSSDGPHLQFRCTADAMPCKALQDACDVATSAQAQLQMVGEKAENLKTASQALGQTLRLAQRLFCALEPADGQQAGDRDAGSVQALLSSQRKREVTAWLEDQVEAEVAESIQEVTAPGQNMQAAIVELLSANDVHGAAAVAVRCGLPRLATVICSGGLSGATRAMMGRQIAAPNGLPCWENFRFFDSDRPLMPPAIAAVYKLLAGDLSSALVFLSARQLSWQRLFAMCLWFGCGPEQPIRAALDSFSRVQHDAHAVCDGMASPHVPLPLPGHLVQTQVQESNWDSFTADVQFVLLKVAAKESLPDGRSQVSLLRQLVRTSAFSGDVLDSLGSWVLLCVLLAVGEAPTVHGQPEGLEEVFAELTLDCAATLLWLGMPTWAVYVLTHLQVADSDSVAAKEALLQQVLDVSCVESSRRNTPAVNREWLNIKCSLPQHQLARADALHALSTGDNAARGRALLDAKLDSDTACFAQTLAGPQHLSWKNSAVFGTWLAECPVDNHGSIDLIHAFMHLKSTLEGRVVQDRLPECVCSDDERAQSLELLSTVCGRIGQMNTACRSSLDEKAMYAHMASVLGKWLLAGAPGSIGLSDGRDSAHMPAHTVSLHNIVLGVEC